MAGPALSDTEFIAAFELLGAAGVAREYGLAVRPIHARRRRMEQKYGRSLQAPSASGPPRPGRLTTEVHDGIVLVGGDGHYWPHQPPPLMHMAFVQLIKRLKPSVVVVNGDSFDGASISRHPRVSWTEEPTVADELSHCNDRLEEIRCPAAKIGAETFHTLGNHDQRYEARIAQVAPELARVHGTALHDHFSPEWKNCYTLQVNSDTYIRHRPAGSGVHSVYNNTLKSGANIVTNHLHSPRVVPWTDYNGTRYGVDTGCLADVWAPQFEYLQDGYRNWQPGAAILTFRNGVLLPPELCLAISETEVVFRGEVWQPARLWE